MKIENCPYTTAILLFFGSLIVVLPTNLVAQKIKGMSLNGPEKPSFQAAMFEAVKVSNADWLAFVPEATLDRTTLKLKPDKENNWWGETIAANIAGMQLAKQAGFKVFLKPHIVLGEIPKRPAKAIPIGNFTKLNRPKDKTRGVEWRGEMSFKKEADWQQWETAYEKYILELARIAEEVEVDLFSIGTELKQSAWKRPAYWHQLIQKVRAIYKGKLIYSANWDEYQKITFWQDLDYIGVDTYFPISKMETPSVKKTMKNWRSIQKDLKRFSKKENLKIVLTEYGYRNVAYAGKRPWTHDKGSATTNNLAQRNLYQAFFETFWTKKWIAGGFAWKWFCVPPPSGNTSFSMQRKPA
ncbi:MAG: hypothetical protein AB8G86_07450, partial [Saprospiraceae bacterium]